MPRDFSRSRRVEEQIRRELSELIRHDIKEPGLGILSVAEVRVTSDLSLAHVYISVLDDDAEVIQYSMDTLRNYAPKLRGLLGKRMYIRTVPQLDFIYDDLIQKSAELDHLIDQAVDGDRQKASDYGTDVDEQGGEESGMTDTQRDDHG